MEPRRQRPGPTHSGTFTRHRFELRGLEVSPGPDSTCQRLTRPRSFGQLFSGRALYSAGRRQQTGFLMTQRFCLGIILFFLATNCALATQPSCLEAPAQEKLQSAFQKVLDGLSDKNPEVPGVLLHVEAPDLCLSWSGAAGVNALGEEERLRPDQPFRIASNTKTYTAAAILRLVEKGEIFLDDSIEDHLPASLREMLQDAGYDLPRITVRHLLTHTSGLYDHTMHPEYVATVVANPRKRWTREEQIRFGVDHGKALSAPGERFRYNDSGYVLLGGIVEQKTGKGMAAAFRQLLRFDDLGLSSTWLETLEPRPQGVPDLAHQYYGEIDTYGFDPSMDLWGGGGIAATSRDLALFLLYLIEGRVFEKQETLRVLLSMKVSPDQGGYRAGIHQMSHAGMTGWGHTGFWNTFAVYFPRERIAIAGSINQNQGPRRGDLIEPVLKIIKDLE